MTTLAAVALAGSLALAGAPVKVTLDAPGHAPHVGKHWVYAVHATRAGQPVAARLTVQIVDPIGGRHPVDFAASKKPITNRPFRGTFRDYIIWPASSRGIPLKLRVAVRVAATTRVLTYSVTPRA